jgi:tetratricopeptide (TPR) repeat protein
MFYDPDQNIAYMIKKYRYIILAVVSLLLFSTHVRSQSYVERRFENIVLDAVEKLNNHDINGAKSILSDIIASDASCDAAWYYMGQVAIYESDIALAEECLRKAVELDPGNFWYRYRLAKLYSYTSKEVAVEMYENLMDDFPKKSDLYFEMVELYIAQQEYEKALETIDEIEKVFGPTEGLAVYAYRILYTLGRQDEALERLRLYNSKYSSPYVLTILADLELAEYDDSTAVSYYDEALELDSSYSPALLGKAEACRMSRRYDEYFPVLNRFVENKAADAKEKTEYLSTLVEKSDPNFIRRFQSQIDTTMIRLADAHPGDSLVYNLRGLYYFYTGRDKEAADQFRQCVDMYPESLGAAATLVEFLMYGQKWEELSEDGRKAYDRFPRETAFLEMASMGDYNLGHYDKVLELCDKVLEVAPTDSSATLRAWSTKGDIYHILGDSKKAYKAYDKALKINPDYIYVLNNYAYYLSIEGKSLKKAYEMSRKTVQAEPDNATFLDTFGWILYLRGELLEAKSIFATAIRCGGKDSAVIMDHYADVLYALKEYDMAFIYWNLAMQKNKGDIPDLKEKVELKRAEAGK